MPDSKVDGLMRRALKQDQILDLMRNALARDRRMTKYELVEHFVAEDFDPLDLDHAYYLALAEDVREEQADELEQQDALSLRKDWEGHAWVDVTRHTYSGTPAWGFERVWAVGGRLWTSGFRQRADVVLRGSHTLNQYDAARLVEWLDRFGSADVLGSSVAARLREVAING